MVEQKIDKKQLESLIAKIGNIDYGYYYDDKYGSIPPRCGKTFFQELRQKGLNCSDKAPHQEEIKLLSALGLSYPQIRKILEKKYYSDVVNK